MNCHPKCLCAVDPVPGIRILLVRLYLALCVLSCRTFSFVLLINLRDILVTWARYLCDPRSGLLLGGSERVVCEEVCKDNKFVGGGWARCCAEQLCWGRGGWGSLQVLVHAPV